MEAGRGGRPWPIRFDSPSSRSPDLRQTVRSNGEIELQSHRSRSTGPARLVLSVVFAFTAVAAASAASAAEQGWVKGDLRLNLRTGPATSIGSSGRSRPAIRSRSSQGDRLAPRADPDDKVGWIPDGYLDTSPPAATRLATPRPSRLAQARAREVPRAKRRRCANRMPRCRRTTTARSKSSIRSSSRTSSCAPSPATRNG